MASFAKKGRSYTLDGEPVTSVTTAIGVLDKPALVSWAARMSASYAVENWDELAGLPMMERAKRIEDARWNSNRAATTKGHRIHALAEAVAKGEHVRVPDDLSQAAIEAYARMLDQWQMTTVATELPVANDEFLYAGTADLVVTSPRLGSVLLDAKTGKNIYSEVALQLSAYRNANLRLQEVTEVGPRGGRRTALLQLPMFEIDRTMVVHVHDDAVSLQPVESGPAVFDQFVRLLYLHDDWIRRTGWNFRKDASYDPPVREPIFPEISDTDLAHIPA